MNIEIDKIIIGKRRKPNPDKVREIAASIEEVGLINPIVVYKEGNSTAKCAKTYLVAGLHRLEALKSLGHTLASVDVTTEDRAELVEIDENLMREDLSEIERARLLKRRQAVLRARSVPNRNTHPGSVREMARDTGLPQTTVHRGLDRADKIKVDDPVLETASGVELDALASLAPDEQRQAVERVKTGASENFRDARDFIRGTTPEEDRTAKDMARLRSAWGAANDTARAQFWSEISGWRKSA